MTLNPGAEFAGYRIIRQLGTGGMGEVYLVENPQLGRHEALKVVRSGRDDPQFYARFSNEARMAAALDHPAIVTIFAHGSEHGIPWFTMSYVAGGDLTTEHLSAAGVASVVTQIAGALDYAHARGVVHRDIKPANIVVHRSGDGAIDRAILLDFGIAKSADSAQLTATESFIGSVAYTAPEVLSGAAASPWSDQYALACTAFETLTGRAPYLSDNVGGVLMKHLSGPIPLVSQSDPSLAALDPVFARALAKDPSARFRSCGEFAAALNAALSAWSGPTVPLQSYAPSTAPITRQVPQTFSGAMYGGQSGPMQPPIQPGPMPAVPGGGRRTGVLIAVVVAVVLGVVIVATVAAVALSGNGSDTIATSTSTTSAASTTSTTDTTTTSETTTSSTGTPGQEVVSPSDAPAGTCVRLSGANSNDMSVTTVSCVGTTQLSFFSAGTVPASGSCPTADYSYVTFPGATSKLCMVPNMTQGSCYQINPSNIVDYGLVTCGTAPATGATVYLVTKRVYGIATCSSAELAVNYAQPSTLGYCLKPQG